MSAASPLPRRRTEVALAGLVSGLVALGAEEVLARLVPRPSLVLAVGEVVIAHVPGRVSDSVISMFGTSDKAVLVGGIVAVCLVLAAGLALAARHRFWVASVGFGAATALGVAAGVARSSAAPVGTVGVGAGAAAAGLLCLHGLLRGREAGAAAAGDPAAGDPAAGDPAKGDRVAADMDGRRRVLRVAGAAAAAVVVAGAAGRRLAERAFLGTDPASVRLATAAARLPPVSPSTSAGVAAVTPVVTANGSFYRIDTALVVPRVDLAAWRLRVTGMVDQPLALTFAELNAMAQAEADVTISCVSNQVGGHLVGNARWQGVPLADLLRRAGVQAGATQVVGRSVDGWTGGFPTALALDGRAALVALGMNGSPLPLAHGFPARLVVPGLYGYVSATKWLHEIELTTLEAFDGYWVPRGWAKDGPIKTMSRIDVPRAEGTVRAGPTAVAGVAWAPHRGVAAVEVSVDGGPWSPARLADALGPDTWRQWRYDWDAAAGSHELRVRATDGHGDVQVGTRGPLRPSGATGYHTIRVHVA